MSLFPQEFMDTVGATLNPRRRKLASAFHRQAGQDLGVAVFRAVLELDFAHARPRAWLYVDNHVHLMRIRMRHGFRGNFSSVETFFAQCLSQTVQRLVNSGPAVDLAERELHRSSRGNV